jgi:hypothetical protein
MSRAPASGIIAIFADALSLTLVPIAKLKTDTDEENY